MIQPSDETGHVAGPPAYHQFLDQRHSKDYRCQEIKALARAIRARENRLVLGLPGMGVSNLLRFLVTRKDLFKRRVTFVYMDCYRLGSSPAFAFVAFFEEIARQLHEQELIGHLEKQVLGYERLCRLLARAGGDAVDRIVIVVDQADELVRAADEDLYRKLKALTNLNKRVCYIFSSSPSMAGRVDTDKLLFAGRKLTVGRLSERDCTGAIEEESQRLGVDFDPATRGRLAYLTGGHPGLLRAVSSAAVEEGLDGSDADETWVERLLAREDVKYRCQKMWKELDPAQRFALQSLAEGQTDAVRLDNLVWFQDLGLVNKHQATYQLFSPLFQHIVTVQEIQPKPISPATPPEPDPPAMPLEPVRIEGHSTICRKEQEIIIAGKVFKGSQEVRVSPLELRLIACLKQHEGKVASKEVIARYVYYDEHVSCDEAERRDRFLEDRIEDLVRQVRKRLGKQYIKTHWGQGYEFLG